MKTAPWEILLEILYFVFDVFIFTFLTEIYHTTKHSIDDIFFLISFATQHRGREEERKKKKNFLG